MIIRPARVDELPYLQARLNESKHEKVDLAHTILHVAEEDGKVIGLLPARMIWQAEPLWIFPEVSSPNTRRRAAVGLAREMEQYIGDRVRNITGVHSYFFVTKSRAWAKLAEHFGCLRIYRRRLFLGRDL